MKKMMLMLFVPVLFTACKPKATDATGTGKTDSVKYAYSIKKPDNWIIDTNTTNTQTVLKALKDYETNDTADMKKYFADSIAFNYDSGKYVGPIHKFFEMAAADRGSYKTVKVTVEDWEPVVSKDGKDKWVTVWYKLITTNLKGKTDSTSIVNDTQYKDGKIARMDEYVRALK